MLHDLVTVLLKVHRDNQKVMSRFRIEQREGLNIPSGCVCCECLESQVLRLSIHTVSFAEADTSAIW